MPTTPFNKKELAEFEALINTKITEAENDLTMLKENMVDREAAQWLSAEEATQLAERQSKFIKHLQAALARIHNRTYGICRITGKPISKERLRLVPHASFAINHATK